MNFKNSIKATALLLSVGIGSLSFVTAQATDKNQIKDHSYNKWYLGTALGTTQLEPRVTVADGVLADNRSSGYKVYAGYQLNNALSIEAFYADLGAANINIGTDNVDIDYEAFGVGLGYSYKLSPKFKLTGKLGIASLDNEIDEGFTFEQINQNTLYLGTDLEYRINQRLSWRVEYDYFDEDYQMLSTGFKVHFY